MPAQKYQGLAVKRDSETRSSTYTYYGSRSEMETLAAAHTIGETGSFGVLKSLKLRFKEDTVWECELNYELSSDGSEVEPPDCSWGAKSCRLRGSMLSRPLEAHPRYRTCWNHFLFARNGIGAPPAWHATATDTLIPTADRENFYWARHANFADEGFVLLAGPTKPGIDSFDTAVYTVTETARFRSASTAGTMVAEKLNRIGAPTQTFGNPNGNWKCDDAEVSWSGKYWLAKLTWTRSGTDDGWDEDLYGSGGNNGNSGGSGNA